MPGFPLSLGQPGRELDESRPGAPLDGGRGSRQDARQRRRPRIQPAV